MVALPTNQGQQQASVQLVTGTAYSYIGDWMQLFADDGITVGQFNGALLTWINQKLGTTYGNLMQAQQAFAEDQGYLSWSQMGTFDAS